MKDDVLSAYDACAGVQKNGITVFSAHQMGTARMGADPKKSCVDPDGECWEVCTCCLFLANRIPSCMHHLVRRVATLGHASFAQEGMQCARAGLRPLHRAVMACNFLQGPLPVFLRLVMPSMPCALSERAFVFISLHCCMRATCRSH